jgi:hypothetical protein
VTGCASGAADDERQDGTVRVAARWTGRLCSVVALVAWSIWIGWRLSHLDGAVGVGVVALELVAFAAAAVLAMAPWSAERSAGGSTAVPGRAALLPVRLAAPLGVPSEPASIGVGGRGSDDTGEVALARQGLSMLDPRTSRPGRGGLAWAVVATEGIRRAVFVGALVVVLFSGRFPFPWPPVSMLLVLVASQFLTAVGLWLSSGGALRPGDRLVWSMASIGAGLGDGVSRSGLPIRWAATMATVVVLNLAVSLRGVSDRWTHGLGAMARDERALSMAVAAWLVVAGLVALHRLPHPVIDPYGATRRLEEGPTRRLALGTTFAVALLGVGAGLLPGPVPA